MKERWLAVVLLACTGSLTLACKAPEEARPAEKNVAPAAPSAPAATASPIPPSETAPIVPARTESEPTRGTPGHPPVATQPKPTQATRTAPAAGQATAPIATAPADAPSAPTSPPAPTATAAANATPSGAAAGNAAPSGAAAPARSTEVVDPGGVVAVPPGKGGLATVGTEKCKVCHKVQHTSWAGSAHAKRTPPLECESCHGPGSEYKALAVMKDPAKAKAAGVVVPDAAFCVTCHKGKVDPAFLRKVHAHKAAP